MSDKILLFVDDTRQPIREGYTVVKTAHEAIELIKTGNVVSLSLDYDLGSGCDTGLAVAKFIEQGAYDGTIPKMRLKCHSHSVEGKQAIHESFRHALLHWINKEKKQATPQ